jgi:hypothetical protein
VPQDPERINQLAEITSECNVIHQQSTGKASSRVAPGRNNRSNFVRRQADTDRLPGGKMPAAALRLSTTRGCQSGSVLSEVIHKNDVTI